MERENREGNIVWYIYLLFTVCAFVVVGRIIYIQCFFRDSDPYLKYYRAGSQKVTLVPERGSIMAHDGKLLAISVPTYQIRMDCLVRKEEFEEKVKPEEEAKWRSKAKELAKGLAVIFGQKSADGWYKTIIKARTEESKGCRDMPIGSPIDYETLQKVKALPLFNEGQYKGGIKIETIDHREYPYGELAIRTLGHIKNNNDPRVNSMVGIEGSFNHELHGKEGFEWKKRSDPRLIINRDSTRVLPEDGNDIRTTIDIDIQDIADKALRTQLADNQNIEGGCVIVMDVKTGAIRAMVNLLRNKDSGVLGETYNLAVLRAGEPGSVFKTAILMSLLEDGKVKLSDEIPTNKGAIKGFDPDQHIVDFENRYKTNKISIMRGFEMSSNYVFRKLAIDNYGSDPQKLLDNLYLYKLGEAFDFDLKGMASPQLPSPKSRTWSGTDLGSMAIGYSVMETPLHIVTFYNAIANRGRMMKPYLVEDIEKHGVVKTHLGPSVLNGSICSRATADSLTKGLMRITEEGTAARRLKNARLKVAGKTGTARMAADRGQARPGHPYEDMEGRKKYQATFVGFFPAESPKYTAIVVTYSKPSHTVYFGGTIPAMTFREIVDKVYALDSSNGECIEDRGGLPEMSPAAPEVTKDGKVPSLKGLGLMDAIYAIESDGYRYSYSGVGHVVSQSPAAGTAMKEGGTVTIKLE